MPIHIRDPMECDPQWVDVRTKKPIRKKKDLPPEILEIAGVLSRELRDYLKSGAPSGILLQAAIAVVRAQQVMASDAGKKNLDTRHAAHGGSRDKAKAIREVWASGKFSSHSVCAEQEAAALGMSYDTAIKALRNAPDPSR
ncbi:MAG: hypothetical protein ACREPK_09050 [Rhodanobacteraceae bacterium]